MFTCRESNSIGYCSEIYLRLFFSQYFNIFIVQYNIHRLNTQILGFLINTRRGTAVTSRHCLLYLVALTHFVMNADAYEITKKVFNFSKKFLIHMSENPYS